MKKISHGEYHEDDTAGTLCARICHDADDLVLEPITAVVRCGKSGGGRES